MADSAKPKGTFRERRKARRAAKKARIRAMPRKRRILRRVAILGTWLLAFLAAMTTTAVILFYTLSDVPQPNTLPLPQKAYVLYSDGSVMAQIGTVDRVIVSLKQVPEPVRWDVLAAEDRNFYHEPGISISGTLRAAFNDLTGGDVQGGSGITQQYVKNAYLNNSRTLSRKLRELAIAVKLSREYSKDQILEYYLNTVYFGRGTYGIQAAAHAFFGKSVSKLNVSQGALLAALLRAPSYYDPANNPRAAKQRWRYVLDGMVATGHLTKAQEDELTFPKVRAPRKSNPLALTGPKELIVQRVIADLAAHGISENEIYARGLRIKTTISRTAQRDAEHAIHQTFANLTKKQRNIKNALVAVNPKSGAVLAYYGGPNGRDYAGKNDYYDYAGLGSAAPGSSFKPYTLATALQQTLDKKSHGRPLAINSVVSGSYCMHIEGTKICNDPSDRSYSSSKVTVANAMKYSLNTTFDHMAAKVGPDNVAALAHAAGISSKINGQPTLQDGDGTTSFGIGIGDYAVHPIDQAVGFATFANGGMANPAYFVQKATASDGTLVYRHKDDAHRAFSSEVANDVTLTLEPIAGFSGFALDGDRASAAKTGTEGIQSGKDEGGNSDAWTVGFTPQVSAAVWVGSGDATHQIVNSYGAPEYGRDLPGRTWQAFMDSYLANKPKLPLPDKQQITVSGTTTSSAPSTTPASSDTASESSSSSAPSSPVAPSSPSAPSSPPTTPSSPSAPPSSNPPSSPSCAPGLVLPDCSSSPAPPSPSGASSS